MEFDNLGNFIIIEPFFRSLRAKFPESTIQTTLQLTDSFARKNGVDVLESRCFWEYKFYNTSKTLVDLLLTIIWRIFTTINIDLNRVVKASDRLQAIQKNDIIIDFSGDMYGDNALNWHQFIIGVVSPVLAKLLNKKVFFVASSPGPFKTITRLLLTKFSFRFFDIVSVREPVSLQILNGVGLVGEKYCCYPCFSYGFRPTNVLGDKNIFEQEPALSRTDKLIVGMIVCNLNMGDLPTNKWPREDQEYSPFIELITHMVKDKNVRVCIFSHRNKTDASGNLIPGSDHSIINRILELLPEEMKEDVFTINGIYDAATMNRIISKFELLISGRIHGAVQGIMQYIPTLIIDYGMEPKAHKLKGFALLCGLYDYICDPTDANDLKNKANSLWEHRKDVAADLEVRIPEVVIKSQQIWNKIEKNYQDNR